MYVSMAAFVGLCQKLRIHSHVIRPFFFFGIVTNEAICLEYFGLIL